MPVFRIILYHYTCHAGCTCNAPTKQIIPSLKVNKETLIIVIEIFVQKIALKSILKFGGHVPFSMEWPCNGDHKIILNQSDFRICF